MCKVYDAKVTRVWCDDPVCMYKYVVKVYSEWCIV